MTLFWVLAAALAALVVLFVLRPFLGRASRKSVSRDTANVAIYKDQLRELDADLAAGTLAREDYERSKAELEGRLLADVTGSDAAAAAGPGRKSAIWVGAALPVLALAIYFATGTPRALDPQLAMPDDAQIQAMVDRLAAKLRERPDDTEGWKLLGRSYTALGRFDQAVAAFAKAAELSPRDSELLADFADALAMVHGQRLQGEPERLVQRALEIDPNNLKALALAGTAAYERQDYAKAAELWSRMLPRVAPGSEDARIISDNVAEARKLAGIAAQPGVRGTVRLSPKLKGQVKPDDTVFVFARAAPSDGTQGPPMPLAAFKARVSDLPMEFNLNDSMAVVPGLKLSGFGKVIIGARVSKRGEAKPQPGDLLGTSKPVANDARGVVVTIDRVVP
jgi:cytochrome c-type biogenesis protein CcmH